MSGGEGQRANHQGSVGQQPGWQSDVAKPEPSQQQQAFYPAQQGYGQAAYSQVSQPTYPQQPAGYFPAPQAPPQYASYYQQMSMYGANYQQPLYEQSPYTPYQGYLPNYGAYNPGYVPQQYQPYPGVPGMTVPSPPPVPQPVRNSAPVQAAGGGGGGGKTRIPGASCFIFHLPPTVTDETLKSLFSTYGTVLNTYVVMDKATNRSRGFGFVDFSSPAEANAAVLGLNKQAYGGKFLAVSIKK